MNKATRRLTYALLFITLVAGIWRLSLETVFLTVDRGEPAAYVLYLRGMDLGQRLVFQAERPYMQRVAIGD